MSLADDALALIAEERRQEREAVSIIEPLRRNVDYWKNRAQRAERALKKAGLPVPAEPRAGRRA